MLHGNAPCRVCPATGKNPDLFTAQGLPAVAGIFHRHQGGFDKQALFRVNQGSIGGCHAETARIEIKDAVKIGGFAEAGRNRTANGGHHVAGFMIAFGRKRTDAIRPARNIGPECFDIVRPGKLKSDTDHRNRFVGGKPGTLRRRKIVCCQIQPGQKFSLAGDGGTGEQIGDADLAGPAGIDFFMQTQQQKRIAADIKETVFAIRHHTGQDFLPKSLQNAFQICQIMIFGVGLCRDSRF